MPHNHIDTEGRPMKNVVLYSLLVFVALNAFGHAGEVHKYMGTVTAMHKDGSFMLETTAGKTFHVHVSKTTTYRHSDGHVAKASELTSSKRVVVTLSKDGQTASEVKFAASKKRTGK
jgi:hypothetical protein